MDDVVEEGNVLTTVFIGGSPKAGTSSVWYYLSHHPNIYGGEEKEIHFFRGNNWGKGVDWYLSHYPNYDGEKHVLDGSHTLITAPDVAFERIERLVDNPRFIFIVRDPINRLISTYKFGFKYGQKPYKYFGTFSGWVRSEEASRDIEYGKYYEYISRFGNTFGRENVRVVVYLDMAKDEKEVVSRLYGYLGVDRGFIPDIKVINKSGRASGGYRVVSALQKGIQNIEEATGVRFRNRVTSAVKSVLLDLKTSSQLITEEDRQYLRKLYSSDAERLQEYIGRDLSHWSVVS